MEFQYNRDKKSLLHVIDSKSKKKDIVVRENNGKIQVNLAQGKFHNGEDAIPVTFQGKLNGEGEKCSISGNFTYGFYLYTMVIVAAVLIIARFSWSAYKMQVGNMVLCGIVTGLLAIVMIVVHIKAKKAKKVITEFLSDLNVK